MKKWICALALIGACSDDSTPVDRPDVSDVAVDTRQDTGDGADVADADLDGSVVVDPNNPGLFLTPVQDGVSPDGVDVSTLEAAGARVGKIVGATGFTGLWAHCREGDFRLYNEKIEVCVQSETTNRIEMFTGGIVVDARVRGSVEEEVFDLLAPRNGFNVQFAEEVRVVRDGTDGGPAVIRVTGRDTPVAYLLGAVGGRLFKAEGLGFVTEYRLWPQSSEVEIVSWLENQTSVQRNVKAGDFIAVGERADIFRDQYGLEPTSQTYGWIATVAKGSNIGWYGEAEMGVDEIPISDNPYVLTKLENVALAPGANFAWRRWLVVGDGTLGSVVSSIHERRETAAGVARRVTVVDTQGAPQPGRRVLVSSESGEQQFYFGVTDGLGQLMASWPDAAVITVEPEPGFEPTVLGVDSEVSDVEVEVPRSAILSATLTENGVSVPGLVRVRSEGLNEEFFAVPGRQLRLAPGPYQIQVSRGLEYDLIEQEIVVPEEGLELALALTRSVETEGWISADFHQHMEPSTDSAISVRDRILDNVCEGVEFVVPTDHDVVSQLQPWIDELGFSGRINTFPGEEVSPLDGHVNVYPMEFDADERGNGGIPLAYMDAEEIKIRSIPDVFAAARALPTEPVVQLNHPRGGTSFFDSTDFDPNVDDPRNYSHAIWSTDFDTLEVINTFWATCATFADLSQFLNVGLKKTGLGNSDSHDLRGNPAGVPRNYLAIDAAAGQVSGVSVRDALKAGRVTVGANAFIDFTDSMLPGDTVTGAVQTFRVRVQTPSYSEATRLHVVVNGKVVQSLDRTGANGHDFDETLELAFEDDSWVIFFAVGPRGTAWEYGDTTLAFTNAVFVDVDGDGWQAPGMQSLELQALNETGFCR
jgi:hypothetical protein